METTLLLSPLVQKKRTIYHARLYVEIQRNFEQNLENLNFFLFLAFLQKEKVMLISGPGGMGGPEHLTVHQKKLAVLVFSLASRS